MNDEIVHAVRNDHDSQAPLEQSTSVIEWIAAACGAAVLIVMVGYMIYAGSRELDGPPEVKFITAAPIQQGDSFLLPFTATNAGNTTATNLTIQARLIDGATELEVREITIDYLPIQSNRSGAFYFTHNPAAYKISIVASSYLDP
jgi:uncharacterized protein (TIGR02588 family)